MINTNITNNNKYNKNHNMTKELSVVVKVFLTTQGT